MGCNFDRLSKLLTQAATQTRKRRPESVDSEEARAVVEIIEDHLFTPGFTPASIDKHPLVGSGFQRRFRSQVGVGPKKFLKNRRLEVAAWLLVNTDEEIWQIAAAIGHSRYANFTRDFKKWSGTTPGRFRQEQAKILQSPSSLSPSIAVWWQALAGVLPTRESQRLIAWIEPPSSKRRGSAAVILRGRLYGREQAKLVWEILAGKPLSLQDSLLRYEIHFGSPELFHFLGEKSHTEGQRSRERGVELAKLALASLEGSADLLGDAVHDLQALGWARLGQARRLALDKDRADEDFDRSDAIWRAPPRVHDCAIEAEICSLKGTLRMYQRRFEEARELLHRAVALSRTSEARQILIKSLIQRGRIIDYLGDHPAACADYQLALRLIDQGDRDPYLMLAAYGNLANSYAWANKPEKARIFLKDAKRLSRELGNRLTLHQLQWVEALASEGELAEELLRRSRVGFIELGELDHAAVVALELAIRFHNQGRCGEAMSLASEAIPVLEALKCNAESAAAHALLSNAVAQGSATTPLLRKAQALLVAICRDPAFRHR